MMHTDRNNRVLVIGAGASGMAAALTVSRHGADVTVIEHNSIPGKKLLITGNGRCNYTNTDISVQHYNCADSSFVKMILERFGYAECMDFFKGIGIEPKIVHYPFDDSGYVYPSDERAISLRDALYEAGISNGVKYVFDTGAERCGIKKQEGGFNSDLGIFDALVLASGSNAYPQTGSDSSLYPLIKELGLGFKTFTPALCALYSKDERLRELKGRRVKGSAALFIERKKIREYSGEIQFNEHSISGIPVMQLAGFAAPALKEKKTCVLKTVFDGGSYTFLINRTAGFERAQCARGGIPLEEIDPGTLQSSKVPGVYICGELLDIDGECGGYNLHLAWASGCIAGSSAAV